MYTAMRSPLEERTQFHERFESVLQERFTMPDSGMDEAEDEGTIGFILQVSVFFSFFSPFPHIFWDMG